MPEGPEIRRAADNLEAAIKGKPLTDVWFAFPQLKSYQSRLIGQHVTHVETRLTKPFCFIAPRILRC